MIDSQVSVCGLGGGGGVRVCKHRAEEGAQSEGYFLVRKTVHEYLIEQYNVKEITLSFESH